MTGASQTVSPAPGSAPAPAPVPARPGRLATAVDLALRVVGGLLACVAAALTVVLELLFAMVRVGGYLVGLSVLLAVVANVGLSWFAYRAVGAKWAVALPAVVWFVLILVAGGGTDEGDILLAGNWVGFLTIIAGSMAFAVMGFRLILTPRP